MLVKGGDYRPEDVVGREIVEADGGEVLFVDILPGHSTSAIVRRSAARRHAERPGESRRRRRKRECAVPRLSAIIITKNEAHNIAACLAGVAFCDERIVVDSGSSRRDVEDRSGSRRAGHHACLARLRSAEELCAVAGDRRLGSVDRCRRARSPALAREIEAAIAAPQARTPTKFRACRVFSAATCGRRADPRLRAAAVSPRQRALHATISCMNGSSATGRSRGSPSPCTTTRLSRLEDAISRIDRYSTAGAEMLVASGRRVSFMSGIGHGLWTFIRVYFLQLGFLDGREGFLAGCRERGRQLLSLYESVAPGPTP